MRRFISYLLCISLVVPLVNTFTLFSPQAQAQDARGGTDQNIAAGIRRLKSDTNGAALVTTSTATGAARFVRISSGSGASLSSAAGTPRDQSAAFFNNYGGAFGVSNPSTDLKLVSDGADAIGGRHLVYLQNYKGVPVFAGVIKTHFDASGALRVVNGNIIPNINLNPVPSRTSSDAARVAVEHVRADPGDGESAARSNAPLSVAGSTLYVYRANLARDIPGPNHLVWEVKVGNGADVRDFVYVDAHSLKVVDKMSGHQDALFRRGYDGQGLNQVPPDYPSGPEWVEGDPFPTGTPELDNMIIASGEVYNMFFNGFNRDSYDGSGHVMDSIYNRGYGCPNASWNGTFISFCPGFTTDDVTAHEWGHAYTEYTHGLIYAWQPGALNESYSDIWGETVDRINGRDTIGNSLTDAARTAGNCSSFSPARALFEINSPAGIAGTYPAQAAQFGPALSGTGITGDVVLAVDDNAAGGTDPNDGCGNITNGAALTGKIALMRRGLCNFSDKVYRAQQAGAIAAIIFNNAATGLPGMGAGVNANLVTIPSIGVTKAEGDNMIANINTPPNVTMKSSTGSTDNSTRWLMGEDVNPGGALRDMYNPICYSNPGRVLDSAYYVCSTADQGGVHTNSGVPNHAYALLVDGGTYNGQTVTAIGLTKAAHIYYRAMTVYQHPSSNFVDHADAIEQSALDLQGANLDSLIDGNPSGEMISAADIQEVKDAVLAVEMRTPPTFCNFQPLLAQSPPSGACAAGTSQAVIFEDDFEGDNTDWTVSHVAVNPAGYSTPDWVASNSLPDNRAGTAFFAANPDIGSCTVADDESGVQHLDSPTFAIPSTVSTPILRFDHWVATEANFDGGQLLVSVNGGAFTLVPQAAFIYNAHNLTLATTAQGNTNPKQAQRAWSGTDGGAVDGTWGTTVVDLSQAGVAAGNTVQLRYDMSQDGCGGSTFGWYIDNLKVSACLADVDMEVTNTASDDSVLPTEDVTWTIVAKNNSATDATSVKVIDTINSYGTYVSASVSQGSFTQNGNVVTANFGTIPGGGSATLTVTGDATYFGKLSNTAVVSAFEPDTSATTNNTDTENTRVVSLYRLYFDPPSHTGPCNSTTGWVRLTEAAPAGGIAVNLSESDPALTIPAQVTVPAGEFKVSFNATSSAVNTGRIVNVTASLADVPTVSVVGRVKLTPTTIMSLTFNPPSPVEGGTDVTATVTLSCAPAQDTLVTIQTSRNAAKPQVSQITIPAGQTQGQFLIKTKSPGQTVTANIKVTSNGRYLIAPLTVTPPQN